MSSKPPVSDADLGEIETALRQCVARLALLAADGHPDLEQTLDEVREHARGEAIDPPLLKSLTQRLSGKALGGSNSGAAAGAILGRLLDHVETNSATEAERIRNRLEKPITEVELEILLEDLGRILGPARDSAKTGDPQHQVRLVMIDLLRQINLPEKQRQVADSLVRELDDDSRELRISGVIGRVADIIASLRNELMVERLSNERFLGQLTQNLQVVEQSVMQMETHRQDSIAGGRQLDANVRDEMQQMQSDVTAAGDLDGVKAQLAKRIEAIREHVDAYRQTEDERNEALAQQVKGLNDKLQQMERETAELQEKMRQAHHKAQHDALTGVANRLAYDERVVHEYARWKRYQRPLSIVLCDIDHFKKINDQYGHVAGDKALKTLAALIQRHLRETDFFARYGGEEFVVLMTETALPDAVKAAENLRAVVAESGFNYKGQAVKLTASFGVSDFRGEDRPREVLERADAALYAAKDTGRNQVSHN